MRRKFRAAESVLLAAVLLALAACAVSVHVVETTLTPRSETSAHVIVVNRAAAIQLGTGYTRELLAGSRWHAVGTLPQGDVFKPAQGVFSIEGRHVHEAYLVIREERLRGFYLPAESRFSPLEPAIELSIGATT